MAVALLTLALTLANPSVSGAQTVIVHDSICVKGKPVMLSAETRGLLFRQGGEVVEFSVDGKPVGQALSGGDGIAYKEYTSTSTGKLTVKARWEDAEGEGTLLCMQKGAEIVFIEISGALTDEGTIPLDPREGGADAVKRLGRKYTVIYIAASLQPLKGIDERWLEENKFPPHPVMPESVIEDADELGLKVKAVIGSSALAANMSARGYKVYSFSEGGGELVEDWKEAVKRIEAK